MPAVLPSDGSGSVVGGGGGLNLLLPAMSRPLIVHPRHRLRRQRMIRGNPFAPSDVVELLAAAASAGAKRRRGDDDEEEVGGMEALFPIFGDSGATASGGAGAVAGRRSAVDVRHKTRRSVGSTSNSSNNSSIDDSNSIGGPSWQDSGEVSASSQSQQQGNEVSASSQSQKRRRLHSSHVGEVAMLLSFSKVSSSSNNSVAK